jgi:hypothetical protein
VQEAALEDSKTLFPDCHADANGTQLGFGRDEVPLKGSLLEVPDEDRGWYEGQNGYI